MRLRSSIPFFRFLCLSLLVPSLLGVARTSEAQCDPVDGVEFVCGPVSPEDLLAVPDQPWIISAGMEDDGYLYATHARDHQTTVLFPTNENRLQPDEAFAGCVDPRVDAFRPHGLSIRPGQGGQHVLYVVRHGARESIEVFALNVGVGGTVPSVTWTGCIQAPDGVAFNSVAALPDGGLAATNFKQPKGELWEWQADTGWTKVPGSDTGVPNGLVVSPDGRWFYIGGYDTKSVIRLSRGRTPVQMDSVEVGFNVDNIRWSPDGTLLAAGHLAEDQNSFARCWGERRCEGVTSHAARVDPDRLTADEIIRYRSNEHFLFGTVALQVGDEIWLGGVNGSNRIARFPGR